MISSTSTDAFESYYTLFDQTFSAENLRKITETEQRKGSNPSLDFFPSVLRATEELKDRIRDTKAFRAAHKRKYTAAEQITFDALREARETARKARDQELLDRLRDVSDNISNARFQVDLQQGIGPNNKPIYLLPPGSAECFYAVKQISRNIERIYKVKQANRNRIVSQLQDLLNDGFPYHIIRLDVKNFYESIEHRGLIKKLRSDQLLSATSISVLEKILWKYGSLAGTPGLGLPRGVGISAALSELYMRQFDRAVRIMPEVTFFARYVDDIVVVFAPCSDSKRSQYRDKIIAQLDDLGLKENPLKKDESPPERRGWDLTYLGYKFSFHSNTSCKTVLSDQKFTRYQDRLKACFTRYHSQRAKNAKKAYRLLVKRIQYLTGNTQLTHSKSNAFVGIYFSSPHLTDLKQLRNLDGQLRGLIAGVSHSPTLQAKLSNYSFQNGYEERSFRRFHKPGQFEEITKAWNYGR